MWVGKVLNRWLLTRGNVARCYSRFVASAQKALARGDYDGAVHCVTMGAKFAYEFNIILRDDEMEQIVSTLSEKILGGRATAVVNSRRLAFYDAFGLDNKVLAQQYIRAIGASGYECLYLYEENLRVDAQEVLSELATYSTITVLRLPAELSPTQRVVAAHEAIRDFGALRLFLQLCPWSVEAMTVVCALEGVTSYNINLQDHAFGVGLSFVDRSIEFRDYGATLSVEMRRLRPEQLVMLPYYPILHHVPFAGFPPQAEGRVVIFSGGSPYKIYGENDAFFKLAKRLLDENPQAVLLFACGGKAKRVRDLISREGLQDRFILIGHRRDICAVYENSDIFLSTYPFFGGLMSQYAASYAKPILAYTDPKFCCNSIEDFVCHNANVAITYRDVEAFFTYAHRLCSDADLRRSDGARLINSITTVERFNAEFKQLLTGGCTSFPISCDRDLGWSAVVDNLLASKKVSLLLRYWWKGAMARAMDAVVR